MANERVSALLVSKTFWGSVVTAAAWLYQQSQLNGGHLDMDVLIQGIGGVLTATGVKDALVKAQLAAKGSSNG